MKHELSDINPQKMDSQKWDMLLDLLEHPEKYSETQKDELLGDEEVNELYQQLIETRQSLDFGKLKEEMKMPSIDAEWEKLKEEMKQKEEMSQNAETQQTTKLFPLWSPMRKVAAVAAVLVVSGITFAAIHLVTRSHQPSDKHNTELVASQKDSIQQVTAPQKSNIEEKADSASLAQLPLVYENAELQNILTPIAEHFHLQVTYQNESARHIRLFLQLEKNMSLDDIIELMNHFEKVNIRHEGQTLIVE
ncbi:DUF4974 domain-containing protein [Segatella copri]|uniref:DUF4974 domain-containing protein n=1 Tax=Segatella copri TaxID=165179 RepID=A0AAW5I6N0_9BACT|nr:DUF4974 domain-containing protein [Segatella copri]MCF0068162.1 DUF4974 domain-containing protein [Segatella copri]MCP9459071.1 DUF4974 domain-containing protein [Segatella copri]MCP9502253.1 DUF4974 domain-containing protein [Segatella copri]MCP9505138.1 DUF4974 domain-containing protein [Segatella copri]MCP9508251.1 DUF4974 domain-containing protein [Segatella copri]